VGGTRVLFALGRAKMLPAVFGKVHPKYKTPTAAIIMVEIICYLSPRMGKNALVWFVNASAFGTVVAYLLVAIAHPKTKPHHRAINNNPCGLILK